MLNIGDRVKVVNPNTELSGELFEKEALDILTALDFTGVITKIEDDLNFVGFSREDLGWVTQVFKDDEIEVIADE